MINLLFWSKIRIWSLFKIEGTEHTQSLQILVSYIMLTTCNKPYSSFHYLFSYGWYHRLLSFVQYSNQANAITSATFSGVFTVAESAEYTYRHMHTYPFSRQQGDFY